MESGKKPKEISVNFDGKFMLPGKTNHEDRINFVKFWANYIKSHSDEEWSEQQNIVINSQMQ